MSSALELKPHSFRNIGSRNKGIMWEHITACAYRDMKVPGSAYTLTKLFSYGEEETNQHCLAIEEITSQTALIIDEFERGIYTPSFFEVLRSYYQKPYAELKHRMASVHPERLSTVDLLSLYDQFYIVAGRTYPPMLIAFFSAFLDEYFTNLLIQTTPHSRVELLTTKTNLLTMSQVSFTEREDQAISELVYIIKKNSPCSTTKEIQSVLLQTDIQAHLERIAQTFGWFHMEYAGNPRFKEHYAGLLATRLASDVFDVDIVSAKREVLAFQKKFFHEHHNQKLQDLVSVIHAFMFILDDSKVSTIANHHTIYPILEEIAHRLSCTVADIYLLSQPELHAAATCGSIDNIVLTERKRYRAVFLHDKIIQVFSGLGAKELADQYLEIPLLSPTQEIHGLVAYPGLYQGTVCMIRNPKEHGKFKKGDVLVTRDGSAEFTYFLQHAGAVVCDQGGIISHAAIVARESKVPTILNTKNATQVLNDGDLVEVDAHNGTVRKIKNL